VCIKHVVLYDLILYFFGVTVILGWSMQSLDRRDLLLIANVVFRLVDYSSTFFK